MLGASFETIGVQCGGRHGAECGAGASCAAGQVVFEPCLEDTHTVVLSMLEAAVVAASDLPRITPASTSSGVTVAAAASGAAALGSSPGVIPSTGLGEQMVQDTLQVSRHPLGRLLAGCQ